MPDADRPPEETWLNDEALIEHFEWVRAKYASGKSDSWESVPDPDDAKGNQLFKEARRATR